MSLSKRYKPPVGTPFIFSLKATAIGVGRAGIVGSLLLASLLVNAESGVPGDLSEASSMYDTERLRLFVPFELEKFLLPNPDLEGARVGEPDRGISPLVLLSLVKVLVRVGVGGDTNSVGVGAGKEDGAWRADCGMRGIFGKGCFV